MRPCCEDMSKRVPVADRRPDVTVTKCSVCGCRHYEVTVEPGKIGLHGAGL